jgi:NitT/TauT family transport system permease protein
MTRLVPLLVLLGLWQAASALGLVPERLLPSAAAVARALADLVGSGEIWPHTAASLGRAALGLGLAVVVGVGLGVAMAWWRPVDRAVHPLLMLLYPVPKPAIIPLFMIWLGIGDASKVTVIALGCLIPVVIAAYHGARGVDPALLWSARSRGTPERRLLTRVVIPAALPEIGAGVRTALAISFIVLVSSELISSEAGLGFLVFSYGNLGAEEAMLAVLVYLATLGYLADRLYVAGLRRLLAWHEFARS